MNAQREEIQNLFDLYTTVPTPRINMSYHTRTLNALRCLGIGNNADDDFVTVEHGRFFLKDSKNEYYSQEIDPEMTIANLKSASSEDRYYNSGSCIQFV